MHLKNILKKLLPEKLLTIRSNYYNYIDEKKKITYQGKFKNLKEINLQYKTMNTSYYINEYSEYQSQLTSAYHLAVSGQPSSIALGNNRFNIFTSFVSGLSLKHSTIRILDIGGGAAKQYTYLKFCCPQMKLEYTIMELPDVVNSIETKNIPELKYISDLDDSLKNKIDVVLFGSSLHYFEDYKEIISRATELHPKYVVILDTPSTHTDTFACAQVNMSDRIIPMWVLSVNEIQSYFNTLRFKQLNKSISVYTSHNFNNYSFPENESYHYNYIFEKNND